MKTYRMNVEVSPIAEVYCEDLLNFDHKMAVEFLKSHCNDVEIDHFEVTPVKVVAYRVTREIVEA